MLSLRVRVVLLILGGPVMEFILGDMVFGPGVVGHFEP